MNPDETRDDMAWAWRNALVCTCGATGADHCTGCDACPGMAHADDCPQADI